jgi:hypothetical protein
MVGRDPLIRLSADHDTALTEINDQAVAFCHSVKVKRTSRRIVREKKTVRAMVVLYCRDHHTTVGLCPECSELLVYAERRLDLCPYGSGKPACTACPIHCYRPEPRERMRDIMRYAGPRMLGEHPYLALRHLIDERRRTAPPPKSTHEENAKDG